MRVGVAVDPELSRCDLWYYRASIGVSLTAIAQSIQSRHHEARGRVRGVGTIQLIKATLSG